ncbi:hypothetical protein HYALB_00006452 [Hymenoscyphus albidus]|uniref:Uncharacterized protein n=1 Tax=Hymenoscyphus albidus TaxID=595503 RepID=A0A9N9Q4N3_9HELO|nr:hypothetical protein HYALB_00006452 [Hymenoscyphus albidus]
MTTTLRLQSLVELFFIALEQMIVVRSNKGRGMLSATTTVSVSSCQMRNAKCKMQTTNPLTQPLQVATKMPNITQNNDGVETFTNSPSNKPSKIRGATYFGRRLKRESQSIIQAMR